jgi:hypothetical protein
MSSRKKDSEMKDLIDAKGRSWSVNLSLAAARRIEAIDFSGITDQEISVLNAKEKNCFESLFNDAGVIFACIWACIRPQAEQHGVTEDDFLDSVNGDVIAAGKEVWANELADFFQDLKSHLLNTLKVQGEAQVMIQDRLSQVDDKAAVKMKEELSKMLDEAEAKAMAGLTFGD